MSPTKAILFGKAEFFLSLIDDVVPIATTHRYSFLDNDAFERWKGSPDFSVQKLNYILALEAIDKAHLAAVTALVRTKRWADAAIAMYENNNFLGWASCARGLIESSGDILDGLLSVASTIALHHKSIAHCLRGDAERFHNFSQLEKALDHFVLAKWGRGKDSVLIARPNADYVRLLESVLPDVIKIYQRLCSITHPSADSISFLFERNVDANEKLRLDIRNDVSAIKSFYSEFPTAMQTTLMMSCNSPLLILRVLHKFDLHPKLTVLRNINWSVVPAWERIEKNLKTSP